MVVVSGRTSHHISAASLKGIGWVHGTIHVRYMMIRRWWIGASQRLHRSTLYIHQYGLPEAEPWHQCQMSQKKAFHVVEGQCHGVELNPNPKIKFQIEVNTVSWRFCTNRGGEGRQRDWHRIESDNSWLWEELRRINMRNSATNRTTAKDEFRIDVSGLGIRGRTGHRLRTLELILSYNY